MSERGLSAFVIDTYDATDNIKSAVLDADKRRYIQLNKYGKTAKAEGKRTGRIYRRRPKVAEGSLARSRGAEED